MLALEERDFDRRNGVLGVYGRHSGQFLLALLEMGGEVLPRVHLAALHALDACGVVQHVLVLFECRDFGLEILGFLLQRQDLLGHA